MEQQQPEGAVPHVLAEFMVKPGWKSLTDNDVHDFLSWVTEINDAHLA